MTPIVKRIFAIFICAVLFAAPVGLAEPEDGYDDYGLPDDFDYDSYEEENVDEQADLNRPGLEDDAPEPSPTPAAVSQVSTVGRARDITSRCKARVSDNKAAAKNMVDRKLGTVWTSRRQNTRLEIRLGAPATGVYIEWGREGAPFVLTEYGRNNTVISTRSDSDTFPCLKTWFDLDPETRSVRFDFPNRGTSIAEIYILAGGMPASTRQMWLPPHDQADLMVVAAIYGDELLYFGGMLPYYQIEREIPTQIVFATNVNRQAKEQALAALWTAGIRHYPTFLDNPYRRGASAQDALDRWGGEKMVNDIVSLIRRLQPSVVVTNDAKGERNDGSRAAVAQVVREAVTNAADGDYDPISLSAFGGWKVSKLYLHLYEDNPITMDWTTASSALNNQSPLGVARNAFAKYTSLTSSSPFQEGEQYDNSRFGLAFTDVGPDIAGGDLFENVSLSGLISEYDDDLNYNSWDGDALTEEDLNELHNLLTPIDEPEPTPKPTPEPSPTPVPSGFAIRENLDGLRIFLIVLIVAAVLIGGLFGANIFLKSRGIELNLHRRLNRLLHGKSFRLPAGRTHGDDEYDDEAHEAEQEYDDEEYEEEYDDDGDDF